MTETLPYIVEFQIDGQWKLSGTTRDPDEWARLMQSAHDPDGTKYRIRAGDKIVLEICLRRTDVEAT